jgi:hypothetical protein
MFKKYIVASLFCLISTIAHAQNNLPPGFVNTTKPILCGPVNTVFKTLSSKEIDEKPIWIGQDENKSNYALFINTKSTGFTIVQFGDEMACLLGLGPVSEVYPSKTEKR